MKIQEFDYSINILDFLLWQYNNAPSLTSLIDSKQSWYDTNVTGFLNEWYSDVFNLDTANDFGLAVWSIILDFPLFGEVNPDEPGKLIFGFDDLNQNFDNGNFSNINQQIGLTTEEKRLLLKLRYFTFTTRCDVPDVNSFLAYVFQPYGTVYMLDFQDMRIMYVFTYTVPDYLLDIMQQYDLLPRPAGVERKILLTTQALFGFDDSNQNFDNGNFYD